MVNGTLQVHGSLGTKFRLDFIPYSFPRQVTLCRAQNALPNLAALQKDEQIPNSWKTS